MNRVAFLVFWCAVGSVGCSRVRPAEDTGEVAFAIRSPGAPLAHISIPRTHLGEQRMGEVTLFTNSSPQRKVFQGGSAPFSAALGDLTNDGLDEAVVASGGRLQVVGPSDCSITSFFGPFGGPQFGEGDELAVGDINNDGFEEVVVARVGGGISIYGD